MGPAGTGRGGRTSLRAGCAGEVAPGRPCVGQPPRSVISSRAAGCGLQVSCSGVPPPHHPSHHRTTRAPATPVLAHLAMAAFAAVTFVSSCLPSSIARHSRSPLATAARTSVAASASRSFASSSVFGRRLVGSVLGFTLGISASSVRAMETVSASAQVTSGSSIYDFVVKVFRIRP